MKNWLPSDVNSLEPLAEMVDIDRAGEARAASASSRVFSMLRGWCPQKLSINAALYNGFPMGFDESIAKKRR